MPIALGVQPSMPLTSGSRLAQEQSSEQGPLREFQRKTELILIAPFYQSDPRLLREATQVRPACPCAS
jgi:hypothetical protein